MQNKKAQVWIETVIYTLIAFTLIAAVLAFVKPKIDELQDKAIIEQSISMLKDIDATVRDVVQKGSGNKRKLELSIRKGNLIIDGRQEEDKFVFEIESRYVYSEPGKEIQHGDLIIKTEQVGELNTVTLTRKYENYNLTFNLKDEIKTLGKAATPYNLFITNKGKIEDTEPWLIDVELG